MAKFIRIDLPVGSPDDTLTLAKKASDRHTALGAASPLNGFVDMAIFETNRANAVTLQKAGDDADNLAQSKYSQVKELCGISEAQTAQTKGTVYYNVLMVRDVLLLKHRGAEETLEEYGFSVVISQTGARKNIRVDIPARNPADLLELAADIIAKHTALGAGSPLTGNVDMAAFGTLVTGATALLGEWDTQRNLAQSKHNQALQLIGYGEGQTSQTVGTLYYDIVTIRDRQLIVFRGAEEQLQESGFKVVISSARTGRSASGSLVIVEGDVAAGAIVNISVEEFPNEDIQSITFEATGSALRFYAATDPASPPGASFVEVAAGATLTLTLLQAISQLGFDEDHELLNVKNQGAAAGHYKVTVRVG